MTNGLAIWAAASTRLDLTNVRRSMPAREVDLGTFRLPCLRQASSGRRPCSAGPPIVGRLALLSAELSQSSGSASPRPTFSRGNGRRQLGFLTDRLTGRTIGPIGRELPEGEHDGASVPTDGRPQRRDVDAAIRARRVPDAARDDGSGRQAGRGPRLSSGRHRRHVSQRGGRRRGARGPRGRFHHHETRQRRSRVRRNAARFRERAPTIAPAPFSIST